MAPKQHLDHNDSNLTLPSQIAGPTEIGRLIREVDDIGEALLQLGLREGGTKTKMPQTSRLMDQLIEVNELNLLHDADRKFLRERLELIRQQAPILHMSFSSDPPAAFVEKLVSWLRQEIDPEALLTVGLQPNLGAGSILRTTNRYFDLSLRKNFENKRQLLTEIIHKAMGAGV